MPRWASRITLEITRVRIEWLQDIDEMDARAEGVTIDDHHMNGYCGYCASVSAGEYYYPPSICAFRGLWNSLHAASGYGWDTNPWVWVLEFRRVTP